jgi:hypothetical protein
MGIFEDFNSSNSFLMNIVSSTRACITWNINMEKQCAWIAEEFLYK